MMHENTSNLLPAQTLQRSFYNEFVKFIDRSEKTARTYTTNLRQFAAFLQFKGISTPTPDTILLYRQFLTNEHDAIQYDQDAPNGWRYRTDDTGEPIKVKCKPATVKAYLQSVKQFFTWTEAAGSYPNIAANVHAPKIRQDVHKKEALTAADVLIIEKSIKAGAQAHIFKADKKKKDAAGRRRRAGEQGKRLYSMFLLAVNTGMRTIELHRANIKDLEIINGRPFIYIWGKGHEEPDTKKPLAGPVYEALQEYINARADNPTADGPLFVATGNRSGGQRLAVTTISTMLKRAMQEAGYTSERLTAHSLRHTAGSNIMKLTGNNLFITQSYMRHADPKTTEIYLHVDTESAEARAADALYKLYHNQPENRF